MPWNVVNLSQFYNFQYHEIWKDSNNSFEFYESQPKQQTVFKLRLLYISLIKILLKTDENKNVSSEIVLPQYELDGKYLSASV